MMRINVVPNAFSEGLYSGLVNKESELRMHKRGTLHRVTSKKRNVQKWIHASYPGWVRFQKSLDGAVVAEVSSRKMENRWQILSAFIGFLDRHFRDEIGRITIHYE